MKKVIQNAIGMSFFEMLAGMAIFGAVSVVSFKNLNISQKNIKDNNQRISIEAAEKSVSDLLKKKSLCEAVISNLDINRLNSGITLDTTQDTAEQSSADCVEPTQPLPRLLSESEFQALYQQFIMNCQQAGQVPSGGDRSNPGDCGEPPTNERYSEEEYAQIMERYQNLLREFEQCSEEGPSPDEIPDELEESKKVFNTSAGRVDLRRADIRMGEELRGGVQLSQVQIELDGVTEGEVPLRFTLTFDTAIPGKKEVIEGVEVQATRSIIRNIEMMVQIRDGRIICDNLQDVAISGSATEKICAELGGTMSGSECQIPNGTATNSGIEDELENRLREAICESLDRNEAGRGSLAANLCPRIDLRQTITGDNLSPTMIKINGQTRTLIDNTNCAGYLKGYSIAGAKSCDSIDFGFSGVNCDIQDGYRIIGTNSPASSATCRQSDFSFNSGTGTCSESILGNTTADLCRIFQAGTCEGATAGVIEDAPNNVPCGPSMACSAGNCIPSPDCANEYSVSGMETAEGTSYCDRTDRTVNFDFSGCDETSARTETAGVCQRFQAGTCTGTTAAVLENYPDGTDCGGGQTCTGGVCGTGGGCWERSVLMSTYPSINGAGFPSSRTTCSDGSTSRSEPCTVGTTCETEWKYGTHLYTCSADSCSTLGNQCYPTEATCYTENENCYEHQESSWQRTGSSQTLECGSVDEIGYCQSDGERYTPGIGPRNVPCDRDGRTAQCQVCATGTYDLMITNYTCDVEDSMWCNYEGPTGGGGPRPGGSGGPPPPDDPPPGGTCAFNPGLPCTILRAGGEYYRGQLVDPSTGTCAESGFVCAGDACNAGPDCTCKARIAGPAARPERTCP